MQPRRRRRRDEQRDQRQQEKDILSSSDHESRTDFSSPPSPPPCLAALPLVLSSVVTTTGQRPLPPPSHAHAHPCHPSPTLSRDTFCPRHLFFGGCAWDETTETSSDYDHFFEIDFGRGVVVWQTEQEQEGEDPEQRPRQRRQRPGCRYRHSSIYRPEPGQIVVFGGVDDSGRFVNAVWCFDEKTKVWIDRSSANASAIGENLRPILPLEDAENPFGLGGSNSLVARLRREDMRGCEGVFRRRFGIGSRGGRRRKRIRPATATSRRNRNRRNRPGVRGGVRGRGRTQGGTTTARTTRARRARARARAQAQAQAQAPTGALAPTAASRRRQALAVAARRRRAAAAAAATPAARGGTARPRPRPRRRPATANPAAAAAAPPPPPETRAGGEDENEDAATVGEEDEDDEIADDDDFRKTASQWQDVATLLRDHEGSQARGESPSLPEWMYRPEGLHHVMALFQVEEERRRRAENLPPPMGFHAAVYDEHRDVMWVYGGKRGGNRRMDTLYCLWFESWKWHLIQKDVLLRIAAPLAEDEVWPSEMGGHSVAWVNPGTRLRNISKLSSSAQSRCVWSPKVHDPRRFFVVYGGINNREEDLGDVWLFDTLRPCWTKLRVGGEVPCPRASHSVIMLDHWMYIFGGAAGSSEFGRNFNVLNGMYRLDLENGIWQKITFANFVPPQVYIAQSGLYLQGNRLKAFLFGGIDESMCSTSMTIEIDFGSVVPEEDEQRRDDDDEQQQHLPCVRYGFEELRRRWRLLRTEAFVDCVVVTSCESL